MIGITDPHEVMWANEGLLFVTNADNDEHRRDTLFVYSLEDLSLLGKIGGPGRFQTQPAHSIELFLQPDRFVVNSSGMVSTYAYDLALLGEFEHPGNTYFFEPFGDNLVAREIYRENDIGYYRLNLYDANLHVIRDGRDAAVSGWAQVRRVGSDRPFSSFAEYAHFFADRHWVPYVTRARAAAPQLGERYHEVRYENLHANPADEVRSLFRFLGVRADDIAVQSCVQQASFRALTGREPGVEDPDSHYRKGIIGDWRNHFDDETLRQFDAVAGSLLSELGYAGERTPLRRAA